jgi:thymidine phosphorylase
LQGLVMDVKTGNGAFMPTLESSRELADSIVRVAAGAGVRTTALITDMNQVLGHAAGHAIEVREAIEYLTGKRREARLDQVTRTLAAEMLLAGGLFSTAAEAVSRIEVALSSGRAAEIFSRMVVALGGPADLLERPDRHLEAAPVARPCTPDKAGRIAAVETRAIGIALIELGGGRRQAGDKIDHRVGFSEFMGVGEEVGAERPICTIYAAGEAAWERSAAAVRRAVRVTVGRVVVPATIRERIAVD